MHGSRNVRLLEMHEQKKIDNFATFAYYIPLMGCTTYDSLYSLFFMVSDIGNELTIPVK